MSVLKYRSETMIWREEMSSIRAVQMDLRGLLGIRRMDKVPSARINSCTGDEGCS